MTTLSLRARLALWYTAALLIVLVLFAGDVLLAQKRLGIRRADTELADIQATLANVFGEELRESGSPVQAGREARAALGSLGIAFAVIDDHGALIVANPRQLTARDLLTDTASPPNRTIETTSGNWRVSSRAVAFGDARFRFVIARSLSDVAREQGEVRQAMMIVVPVALLLAGAGGLWLAAVGLRPITTMARQAASLAPTGMEDLGPPQRNDELGQLVTAFNGLVARLRAALHTQRQFMADASHELRTPVSVIRTACEVTLGREHRGEDEYREALHTAHAQSHRLGRLVEDMLVLARADAGGYPLRPVDLYLDDVIDQCRRAVDVLGAERGVTVRSTGATDVRIRGDEELMRRLMLNLLQNAVQHTPSGGAVSVDVSPNGTYVAVRVADAGPGIPEGDRRRIFERFVQLDPSRRSEGTGLGLTIAQWIAEAHDGSLCLESTGPGGSTFRVDLPHVPSA